MKSPMDNAAHNIEVLASVLQSLPDNWPVRIMVFDLLVKEGRTSEAMKLLGQAPKAPDAETLEKIFNRLSAFDPAAAKSYVDNLVTDDFQKGFTHLSEALRKSRIVTGDTPSLTAEALGRVAALALPTPYARPTPERQTLPEPLFANLRPSDLNTPLPPVILADETPAVELPPDIEQPPEGYHLQAEDEFVPPIPIPSAPQRGKATREAVAATTIAILAHAVLIIIFLFVMIKLNEQPPPEITAIIAPMQPETMEQQKRIVVQPTTLRNSPMESPAVNLISTTTAAPVTIPSLPVINPVTVDSIGTSLVSQITLGGGTAGMGGVPFAMKSRCSPSERIKKLREFGGSTKIEDSVRSALLWLQKTQNPDGSWGSANKPAMTGLALLAFMGRCETADSPTFGDNVFKGIMYLVEVGKKNNGMLFEGGSRNHMPYEHGIAAYGLGETYALAKYGQRELPGVRDAFENAVDIILKGQTRRGSWAYGYDKSLGGDLSVTGWNYQALKAARHTNLGFSTLQNSMDSCADFIVSVAGGGGGFGYADPGDKLSLTGAGVLGLQMMAGSGRNKEAARRGLDFIKRSYGNGSSANVNNLYEWYYNTQAFFNAGGNDWKWWNGIFQNKILAMQNPDGSFRPGADDHCKDPVYNTALCSLMLEVYYRYLPVTLSR
jgi:predicted secreted protein